ncbi:phosphate ABC transporter ATP-binding protein PstB [Candidatus Lucifugimonas marina]|jgi:phosphate transport system ATP-binding protein|uniref:Phosphate ABC transporter ATP-binding protein n=1 Tax=Candidatus Lucifugimonas marina TaxID=3038979 RepID=A0AAJ6CUA3_9CHLR|nr:phosphate ABC transporter ATP-binding protein [SAR202 cluster bacterium JH702]MDG0870042.1 phosphate ABC transporter ATP-binding protein [SAR202 cluster bacterium JH639]WFG36394.1 phosphate ABC transporter ATP-binding protein [SAR202 cluster bacterium JH545]WFG40327.1 phosphate ABC transporter ATP-binding protein [SAR202 cluster bacterium JH1073]
MALNDTDLLSQAGSAENILKFDDIEPLLESNDLSVSYGGQTAVSGVSLQVPKNSVVSLIGPSGCGKSTLLRCFNRMNDLIPSASVSGKVNFAGQDIYAHDVDPTEIRFRIGMVFQRPNPFPKSIYENVAFGPRINGMTDDLDEVVETSLRRAAVWDEVKDRLNDSGLSVSGGQQQRICIARALAVNPEIVLMDEPASALDPISTQAIEQLIQELSSEVTIIIVTHNMQQATRISDYAAVMMAGEERIGRMIEYGTNEQVFGNPKDERTEAYVTGRIG